MTDYGALASLSQAFILFGVMPVWMASGFADWICHRRTRIECTSGLRESLLHILLLAEMAPATLAAAFFEINALVVAIMLGAFGLHQLTIYVDLRYTASRRHIAPGEQMVHSLLEYVPVIGGVLVFLTHWPAVLSLFGLGSQPAEFTLRWKDSPLSGAGLAAITAAMTVLVIVPYAEEVWRCWRTVHEPERLPIHRS